MSGTKKKSPHADLRSVLNTLPYSGLNAYRVIEGGNLSELQADRLRIAVVTNAHGESIPSGYVILSDDGRQIVNELKVYEVVWCWGSLPCDTGGESYRRGIVEGLQRAFDAVRKFDLTHFASDKDRELVLRSVADQNNDLLLRGEETD